MDIVFQTTKLAKSCNSDKDRVIEFGPERAKRLGRRLDQMRAASSLQVFKAVHARCHPLIGDRAGQWSADLDHPYRLIFEIADEPIPEDEHGNIDLSKVRKVRVIEIADTHGS